MTEKLKIDNRQPATGRKIEAQKDAKLEFIVGGVPFTMIRVEQGSFIMGATEEQGGAKADEKPAHRVTLTDDYYMGETQVTQALWQAVMGINPSAFKGNDHPVERVSWDDCQDFIRKLNEKCAEQLHGMRFRLPTEAEWEYAARGGKQSRGYKYSGSNDLDEVAWCGDNLDEEAWFDDNGILTHLVAGKRANELGLYDMSGNVFEWCEDWYGDYGSSPQTDPTGPATGSDRVIRGGFWGSGADGCRVAGRFGVSPRYLHGSLGLRLALS